MSRSGPTPGQLAAQLADHASQAVRETLWFRSAPAQVQPTLVVKVLGIEQRTGSSLLGDSVTGPCLVARADCGEESRTFCWALSFGSTQELP